MKTCNSGKLLSNYLVNAKNYIIVKKKFVNKKMKQKKNYETK
jgi:hypothetical protein